MKKFLSLMLALVMVFSCTVIVSAEDDATVITKHPDQTSPSVEVSDPDSVKSYQWYAADGFAEGEITDENAEIIDLKSLLESEAEIPVESIEFLNSSNSYHSENGWRPATFSISDAQLTQTTVCFSLYLFTYLEANSMLNVKLHSDNGAIEDEPIGLFLFGGDGYYSEQITIDEDLCGSAYINDEGYYYLLSVSDTDLSNAYLEAYGSAANYTPIEGETENELSEIEMGGLYRCAITLKDGTVLYSYSFSAIPEIISQPSAADPTIEVTFEETALFKWYEADGEFAILDDSYTEYNYGSFDFATEEWIPLMGEPYEYVDYLEYQFKLFDVNLRKGQTVKLTISNPAAISPADPNLRFYNNTTDNTEHVEWDENGVATFTPSHGGLYTIYQYAFYPETATFKIEFLDFDKTELEGETEKTLKNPEIGKYYGVSVFYGDEIELISDIFLMEYSISKQPSIGDTSVEVNFPNDVDFYEWYTVAYKTFEVTDIYADSLYYPGESIGEPSYYDKDNGYWVGSLYSAETTDGTTCYEYDIFGIHLNEGDVLTLTPSAEIEGNTIHTYNNTDDLYLNLNEIWSFEDGTFTFVAPVTAYYKFYIFTFTEDITFEATLTTTALSEDPIEGEDGPELNTSEPGFYVCFVTFKDGTVIASDMLIVTKDEFGILGDVNDDGVINQYDYILVKRHHFETRTLTEDEIPRADVNKDGTVNQYDYLLIARHYFGTYVIE